MATHVFLVVTTIPGFDSIKTEDVSKVIDSEQCGYILKLFHVKLYVLKSLRKFKSFIKDKVATETITVVHSNRVEEVY